MQKESFEQTSKIIYEELRGVRPEELADFLKQHRADLITSPRPFADYMRMKFREKGILQQNVFLAADLSENYGYKLIAEESTRGSATRSCASASRRGFGWRKCRRR